ncbi:hypothetical protein GCM10009416_13860 [Craurococcus roseus]|uniref:Major facilitator superfamily (MFS) profile domain-containing protein n=1 Tax=Craurococcus roseus TaxID=77585 RepID=A0ABP3PXL3_9PROT
MGASALVVECHRPEERTRVQSLNDFVVFGTMALGSFSSGGLLTAYGWDTVLWVPFFPPRWRSRPSLRRPRPGPAAPRPGELSESTARARGRA